MQASQMPTGAQDPSEWPPEGWSEDWVAVDITMPGDAERRYIRARRTGVDTYEELKPEPALRPLRERARKVELEP